MHDKLSSTIVVSFVLGNGKRLHFVMRKRTTALNLPKSFLYCYQLLFYSYQQFIWLEAAVKGIVHPKMKILSSISTQMKIFLIKS